MAIRVRRHANVSKQTKLLDGIDVGPPKWHLSGHGSNLSIHEGMNGILNEKVHKDSQWKCKY